SGRREKLLLRLPWCRSGPFPPRHQGTSFDRPVFRFPEDRNRRRDHRQPEGPGGYFGRMSASLQRCGSDHRLRRRSQIGFRGSQIEACSRYQRYLRRYCCKRSVRTKTYRGPCSLPGAGPFFDSIEPKRGESSLSPRKQFPGWTGNATKKPLKLFQNSVDTPNNECNQAKSSQKALKKLYRYANIGHTEPPTGGN